MPIDSVQDTLKKHLQDCSSYYHASTVGFIKPEAVYNRIKQAYPTAELSPVTIQTSAGLSIKIDYKYRPTPKYLIKKTFELHFGTDSATVAVETCIPGHTPQKLIVKIVSEEITGIINERENIRTPGLMHNLVDKQAVLELLKNVVNFLPVLPALAVADKLAATQNRLTEQFYAAHKLVRKNEWFSSCKPTKITQGMSLEAILRHAINDNTSRTYRVCSEKLPWFGKNASTPPEVQALIASIKAEPKQKFMDKHKVARSGFFRCLKRTQISDNMPLQEIARHALRNKDKRCRSLSIFKELGWIGADNKATKTAPVEVSTAFPS